MCVPSADTSLGKGWRTMAPFKSQAQRRKFYAMYEKGEISKKTLDEWESATGNKKLPKKLKKKGTTK